MSEHIKSLIMVLIMLLATTAMWAAEPRQGMELLMVEQAGCSYCLRWHAEVGPEYPVTDEGRAAPLLRADLREDLPASVTLSRPAVFTPTFILLVDGQERDRLEGYPGEDFFWAMLAAMIGKNR